MRERAMPKPICTEEIDVGTIEFGRLGRGAGEGRFDGGGMTSDGGVILLGAVDRKLELTEAAAGCVADPRSPLLIKHGESATWCASARTVWRWVGKTAMTTARCART